MMMIIVKVIIKLKKFSELQQKMTSFNHIYLKKISELQMLELKFSLGYNLYVFDIRYQKNYTASQPIKIEFKIDGVVPNNVIGYALVITNKLVSISSDGQRHFDLI